jgi:predicted transcriptional regulator
MKVLLSIKPEYASKILDGTKRYEYRRAIFKRTEVTTVVVYASDPVRKVIGEFDIEEIIHDEPKALWSRTGERAGISMKKFLEYFENRSKGYAIGVKDAKTYDVPISLEQLMIPCPPQSFMYL